MHKIGSLIAVLLLALSASNGQAQVYKWVDADGVTHYSQQPPESGGAKEMPVPSPAAAPVPKTEAGAAKPDTEGRRAQELRDEIRARRAQEDRKQAETDAQRQAACEHMRQNLEILRARGRVKIKENDSYRVLTPEEQAQQIIDSEKQIQDNCSPPQ